MLKLIPLDLDMNLRCYPLGQQLLEYTLLNVCDQNHALEKFSTPSPISF